jgi:23S rRNA (adenine2503-C2)-methyltransferase
MSQVPQIAKRQLKDYAPEALRRELLSSGLPGYRAEQIAGWLYQRDVDDFEQMTNLSQDLRDELARSWASRALEVEELATAADGTRKLALRARDGALIESVLIPEERRNTLCVSTQVGCPLACSFCATGALGFTRNLSTAEIVDQLCRSREVLDDDESLSNVVFMGMGEPLLNLPAVSEAIRILTHPKAFALAPRRITVSTAGIVSKIRPLLELAPVNLAVSLHATTDSVRDELVPLNRKIPLGELLGELRSEPLISRRRPVFFEYTLMEGVNDSLEDAHRLPSLLAGIPCKLNIIPMNAHPDAPYRPPSKAVIDDFAAVLHQAGMRVTLRRSRGEDIDAACGQLARRGLNAAAGQGAEEPPRDAPPLDSRPSA